MLLFFIVSEPSSPTRFNNASSNLDAEDGNIQVAWNQPSGSLSGYRVTLFYDSTLVTSLNVASTSATLTSSDIKNGEYYTLQIETKSEVFESSKVELSDPFREVIRTVVQGKTSEVF